MVKAKERIDHLIADLSLRKKVIGIPTPVVAEVLVHAGSAGAGYLAILDKSSAFRILPFDLMASVEAAEMAARAIAEGDKKSGSAAPWQKVKIDRQIIAIALVGRATAIYTDDQNLSKQARLSGIKATSSWELPIPDEAAQMSLGL